MSLKRKPWTRRCAPEKRSWDAPVKIVLPGFAALNVMGESAVPLAENFMTTLWNSPDGRMTVSPGLALFAAVIASMGVVRVISSATSAEVPTAAAKMRRLDFTGANMRHWDGSCAANVKSVCSDAD